MKVLLALLSTATTIGLLLFYMYRICMTKSFFIKKIIILNTLSSEELDIFFSKKHTIELDDKIKNEITLSDAIEDFSVNEKKLLISEKAIITIRYSLKDILINMLNGILEH